MPVFLVTGATGFLGSALVEALLNRGKRVIGVGRRGKGFLSDLALKNENFTLINVDLSRGVEEGLAHAHIDVIFHLAAQQPSSPDIGFDKFYDGNVTTTRSIITFAKRTAVSQLVYVSTIAVWGTPPLVKELNEDMPAIPTNYYSLTKYIAERLIEIELDRTKIQGTVVRFSSLYGRNHLGGMIYTYYQLAKQGKPIEVYGNGETYRNALYVADAVDVLCDVAEKKDMLASFETFLAGSVNSLPIGKIAEYIRDYMSSSTKIIPVDKPSLPPWDVRLDIAKAKQKLGFSPMTLDAGLKKYVEAMRMI